MLFDLTVQCMHFEYLDREVYSYFHKAYYLLLLDKDTISMCSLYFLLLFHYYQIRTTDVICYGSLTLNHSSTDSW